MFHGFSPDNSPVETVVTNLLKFKSRPIKKATKIKESGQYHSILKFCRKKQNTIFMLGCGITVILNGKYMSMETEMDYRSSEYSINLFYLTNFLYFLGIFLHYEWTR